MVYINIYSGVGRERVRVESARLGLSDRLKRSLYEVSSQESEDGSHPLDVTCISASGRGAEANGPIEAACPPGEGEGERADEQNRELEVHIELRHWRSNCLAVFYSPPIKWIVSSR